MRLTDGQLKKYWEDIPTGKENAITYEELVFKWKKCKRDVREILNELSRYDSGDDYILIRSSRGKGFYKTDKTEEIEDFRKECLSRGRSCLSPIKKMNRVLKVKYENNFDLFTALEQFEADITVDNAK